MIRKSFVPTAAFLLTALALYGCSSEPTKEPTKEPTGHTISMRIEPDPPAGGKDNKVHVTLQDAAGKAVTDAEVSMTLTMPAMPEMKMAEMKTSADLPWTGTDYSAPIQISMAGGWDVVVEARKGGNVLATYKSHIEAR
jgi:hypothetical protein